MALMPLNTRNEFSRDLGVVDHAMRHAVDAGYAKQKNAHWIIWLQFCTESKLDPFLTDKKDPIPYLQIFAQRYRDGRLAPRGKPVTSKYVSNVLASVGQNFSGLGAKDPRYTDYDGKIDLRLRRLFKFWAKDDAPPKRVKPLPITLVRFLLNQAYSSNLPMSFKSRALADTICIAFFYLLRPTEYSGDPKQAFSLGDVHLYIGTRRLDIALEPLHDLARATSVRLHFTIQKNQRKGEVIAQGISGDPYCCPVRSIIRFVRSHRLYFQRQNLPFDDTVRLASYYDLADTRFHVRASDVTSDVRFAARANRHLTGITPSDLSARSARAGGAMALLCGGVDSDTIQLLGRWHGASMLRYLHMEARPIFKRLAEKMFNNGTYSFLPSDWVPDD